MGSQIIFSVYKCTVSADDEEICFKVLSCSYNNGTDASYEVQGPSNKAESKNEDR